MNDIPESGSNKSQAMACSIIKMTIDHFRALNSDNINRGYNEEINTKIHNESYFGQVENKPLHYTIEHTITEEDKIDSAYNVIMMMLNDEGQKSINRDLSNTLKLYYDMGCDELDEDQYDKP